MPEFNESSRMELFEMKQKFLREIPHPKLVLKFIRQSEKKGGLIVDSTLNYESVNLTDSDLNLSLEPFLDGHILQILKLKQNISIAPDYSSLNQSLIELYRKQVQLLKKLSSYLDFSNELPDTGIKMSTPIDTYAILKRIRELNLEENGIKDYLCKEIMAKRTTDIIVENCLRANKIMLHV